jgi:hypothetical protein
MYKLLIIGIMFLLGFYYIFRSNDIEAFTTDYKIDEKCPDVLIQKGAAFFLYNSKRANVPGINPIRFENLDEYVEFTEWQRSQGILCPVLYLQHAYNAQGEAVYKARPSPTNMQGGQPDFVVTLDSLIPPSMILTDQKTTMQNMMPPPANVPINGIYGTSNLTSALPKNALPIDFTADNYKENDINTYAGPNIYPGYDPQNQTIGENTPLDKMFNQTIGVSPNPMDHNWGGVEFTENLVKAGVYKGREVSVAFA